jgi:PAS domain S-box-containing protein
MENKVQLIKELKQRIGELEIFESKYKKIEDERTHLQQRLEALWKINSMVEVDFKTLYDHIQVQTVAMTNSLYGFYGFLNENESVMTVYSWSKEVMEDCQIHEKPIQYLIANAGLWGDAVRERRIIIVNNYQADHPSKKGIPEGHVSLTRMISVPVFSSNRIVAVAAVANKETEYTENDAKQLSAFLTNVQVIIDRKLTNDMLQIAFDELESRVEERTGELKKSNEQLKQQIAERKRAEKTLLESEEKFRTFMETASDLMYMTDKDGNITFVNESMAKTLGYPGEEMIGMNFTKIASKESIEKFNTKMEELITKGKLTFETKWLTKDRKELYGENKIVGIFDKDGNFTETRGIFRDITERKSMEEERENLIVELKKAISNIKTLRGLLPICSSCKKIRDDKGYWHQVEVYMRDHSEAEFTHGFCPECFNDYLAKLNIVKS